MKKSKIKMLTASACLALVGTASAAWVYAGTATASANIGVKVASYASAGDITITGNDKIYIYLDNGSVAFKRDSDTDTLTAKHNVPTEFKEESRTITKTFKVLLSPALSKYVTFAEGVTYSSNVPVANSDGSQGNATVSTDTRAWEDDTDIFNNLPGLKWNQTVNSEETYKTLINSISDSAIADWSTDQNSEWDATKLNVDWYAQIMFFANVPSAA